MAATDLIPKQMALKKLKEELELSPLPLTPELKKVSVDIFLYQQAYGHYSGKRLEDWVYKYIPRFFRWWSAQNGGRIVSVDDVKDMRKYDVEAFSAYTTDGPTSRSQINSTMSYFGGWLQHEGRIGLLYNPFHGVILHKSRVKKKPEFFSETELGKCFDAISLICRAPRGMTAADVKNQYNMFARFVLQTGLRYGHAFGFQCGDFEYDAIVTSKLTGEQFCRIEAGAAIERHKIAIEESIKKKIPAVYVYITLDLYNDIKAWCEHKNLKPTDTVMRMSIGALRDQAGKIKARSGVLNFTWSLRHTWASVVYQMVGDVGMATLVQLGGWQSADMPLQHYVVAMTPEAAYAIVKKYHIYLPPEQIARYIDIERSAKELKKPMRGEGLDDIATLKRGMLELEAANKRLEELIKSRV